LLGNINDDGAWEGFTRLKRFNFSQRKWQCDDNNLKVEIGSQDYGIIDESLESIFCVYECKFVETELMFYMSSSIPKCDKLMISHA